MNVGSYSATAAVAKLMTFTNRHNNVTAKSWWFVSLQIGMLIPGATALWVTHVVIAGAEALVPVTAVFGSVLVVLVVRILRTRVVFSTAAARRGE